MGDVKGQAPESRRFRERLSGSSSKRLSGISLARFCPQCGQPLGVANARFCSSCGAVVDPGVPGLQAAGVPRSEKSPVLAAACSGLLPGLGQVYNGETGKGLAVFFGSLVGFFILFIPGLLFWAYGLHNAYSTARKMNSGQIPYRPARPLHIVLFILLAVVVLVIVYLAIMAIVSSLLQSLGGSDLSSLTNAGF